MQMKVDVVSHVISHVISLGCNCHTAMFLKTLHLKQYSCPFDWVCLKLPATIDILNSHFEKYIDPQYLIDHEDGDPRRCAHSIYGGRVFHHHNPRNPDHHAYFERCISRFCNVQGTRLYLHQAFYDRVSVDQVNDLHKALSYYSTDFVLVVINYYLDSETAHTKYNVALNTDGIVIVNAHTIGNQNGVAFTDRRDAEGLAQFLFEHFTFDLRLNETEAVNEDRLYACDLCIP